MVTASGQPWQHTGQQMARQQSSRPGGRNLPHGSSTYVNVGEAERWLSVLGGGALALYGLSQRSLLGLGLAVAGGLLVQRGLSGHCLVYETLGLDTAGGHGTATSVPAGHGFKVEKSITVDAPAEKLFSFWRNLENLPRVMHHLKEVRNLGNNRSHWVAEGPLGLSVEWDAEIHNERPNEMIAWRSLEGSTVNTAGSVHFTRAPGGRGTEVRVILKYEPPAGKVGAMVARLFGRAPDQEIEDDLHRFKQLMETGDVATVAGQTSGRRW